MSDNDFINDPFERYIVQNPKKINYLVSFLLFKSIFHSGISDIPI